MGGGRTASPWVMGLETRPWTRELTLIYLIKCRRYCIKCLVRLNVDFFDVKDHLPKHNLLGKESRKKVFFVVGPLRGVGGLLRKKKNLDKNVTSRWGGQTLVVGQLKNTFLRLP